MDTETHYSGHCHPLRLNLKCRKMTLRVSFTYEKVGSRQLFLQLFTCLGGFGLFRFWALVEVFTIILSQNWNESFGRKAREREKKKTRRFTPKFLHMYLDFPKVWNIMWWWRFLTVHVVLANNLFLLNHLK